MCPLFPLKLVAGESCWSWVGVESRASLKSSENVLLSSCLRFSGDFGDAGDFGVGDIGISSVRKSGVVSTVIDLAASI